MHLLSIQNASINVQKKTTFKFIGTFRILFLYGNYPTTCTFENLQAAPSKMNFLKLFIKIKYPKKRVPFYINHSAVRSIVKIQVCRGNTPLQPI